MQYKRLGRSGLLVSPICLGTMALGAPLTEREVVDLVHGVLDLGINFIDTANCYEGYQRDDHSPGGMTEEILGRALRGRRDQVILATKAGAPIGPGPQDRGLSATHILQQVEASLRRLQTDYIDLYIIHWPDPRVPLEETLRAIHTAVAQGKVRYVGASNHLAWQVCELLWIADKRDWPAVVSSQIPYSMLRREYERDLPFYEKHDIAVTPYQPLQGGLLTGKYRRGQAPPGDSRAVEKPDWLWTLDDALFDKIEAIETLAKEIGVSMTHYALAWALQQTAVVSLIVGAKHLEQIEDCLHALEVDIPAEHFAEIDRISPSPPRPPNRVRG